MKKNVVGMFTLMLVFCLASILTAFASEKTMDSFETDNPILQRYSFTGHIAANLSFENEKAVCSGSVRPLDSYNCSITVTLYKKNGSGWDYVDSWSAYATGGKQATASGSVGVERGTYKVVASGNVADKEYPSKSVTKTKD